MTAYFLGGDVGGTHTRVLIADQEGQTVGFGDAGSGNHEGVGYEGFIAALREATQEALTNAGLSFQDITAAGLGIGGYDWPSQRQPHLDALRKLGYSMPYEIVNDAVIGLIAGSADGWGVGVVSGTGCNCWGWDRTRQHIGHVTGGGMWMGEAAGSGELVSQAVQAVAHEWTGRGPATRLTPALVEFAGAMSLEDLLEGLMDIRYHMRASAARLVFQVAQEGDPVAVNIIRWAGNELGELAKTVIRQLHFQELSFDVVLIGSMFEGGPLLIEPMRQTVQAFAPQAKLVRLGAPPVVGAVLLAMEQAGIQPDLAIRNRLFETERTNASF